MIFNIDSTLSNLSGVYQIRNSIDGKIYIGSTKDFQIRYNQHVDSLTSENPSTKPNRHLKYATEKYGINNFTFEILVVTNSRALKELVARKTIQRNQKRKFTFVL